MEEKSADFYEQKYLCENEPWGYSRYAVERLRHEFVVKTACSLKANYERILDVGCGKGNLTFRFHGLSREVIGLDISRTAVEKSHAYSQCRAHDKNNTQYLFVNSCIRNAEFPAGHFDLILLCDGIDEWFTDENEKMKALVKVHELLAPGGFIILSDYQKPQHFETYVKFISDSPLKVDKMLHLNDRLCYQFYSWFKKLEDLRIIKMLYDSILLAKILMSISRLLGKNGSKHIFVVARKM